MTIVKKKYDIQFKALPDSNGKTGRFEAYVSTFGNVDRGGDRIMPGAFDSTLANWKASGDPIPLIWSHDWGNPNAVIGSIDPADTVVNDKGLKVIGEIDLTNEFAKQVHSLMKRRLVKEFSFGYEIKQDELADDGATNLLELDIIEIGPTLKGMNPDTELLGVKSALEAAAHGGDAPDQMKALQEMHDRLCELGVKCIASARSKQDEPEVKSEDPAPGKDEEPTDPDWLVAIKADLASL